MFKDRQELDAALDRMETESTVRADFRDRFAFYRAVLRHLFERRGKEAASPREIGAEEARARLSEGFPLIDLGRLKPDPVSAGETFDGLADIMAGMTGLGSETIDGLRARKSDSRVFTGLLGEFLRRESSPEPGPAPAEDEENLYFLLHGALRPLFERHALAYEGLPGLDAWDRGVCPVCGGLPAVESFTGEEGRRRMLHCHLCGHDWNFRRVCCPFCGNKDHEKLRYMRFESLPTCRVDVCEVCRGYLKGFDVGPGSLPEVEDLLTPHLDMVAVRENYLRRGPNSLGLWR